MTSGGIASKVHLKKDTKSGTNCGGPAVDALITVDRSMVTCVMCLKREDRKYIAVDTAERYLIRMSAAHINAIQFALSHCLKLTPRNDAAQRMLTQMERARQFISNQKAYQSARAERQAKTSVVTPTWGEG